MPRFLDPERSDLQVKLSFERDKTTRIGCWRRSRRRLLVLVALHCVLGVFAVCNFVAPLQAQTVWQPDGPIPYYDDPRPPTLIADQNRTVHAFYDQAVGDGIERFLFYRQWTMEQGWSSPVDILLSPVCCTVEVLGVHLDPAGTFHLVFYAGNPPDAGAIYYSTAPAAYADRAPAWSKPMRIAGNAGPIASGTFVGNAAGSLVVLYTGYVDGQGLYEVSSADSGATWSQPSLVDVVDNQETMLANPALSRDSHGTLHAVWGVLNSKGTGDEVHYARQEAGETYWSTPVTLALREPEHVAGFGASWPALIEHEGELILLYEDGTGSVGIPPAMWMRRSLDGGDTWTDPVQPFPQVGGYGSAVLLEDGSGVLHVLMGGRVGNPIVGGLWHSEWRNQRWTEPEAIASSVGRSTEEQARFGPSMPRAVISQGNVLLVTWWNDASEQTVASYSTGTFDAQELAVRDLPMPTPSPSPTLASPTPTAASSSLDREALAPPPTAPLIPMTPGSPTGPGSAVLRGSLVILVANLVILLALRLRSRSRF